jgi:hypothetical protein
MVGFIEYIVDTTEQLYDIHNYARQYLQVASDMMKARCDSLANYAGYQEGDQVWLYAGAVAAESRKLQSSCERPNRMIALFFRGRR